ncbi:SDR family NAD(P)-dependent oxidoreductase [Sorangium sp. So ce131]|uniref:SDR family NAD(P)-dependent oxidoreductase n=1 Tax=Sorangium sp. So ce131 TaxID=3133282 RepID=UPI003F5F4ED0
MSSVFYVFNQVATTYEQFGRQVHRRALALRPWRGGVVALWADNDPDFVVNLFAIWKAGAVPFLVSRRLPWTTVSTLLEVAGASVLATPDVSRCDPSPVPVIPSACGADGGPAEAAGQPTDPPAIGSDEQEVAVILHTSGTTNLPKLVRFTRENLRASLRLEEARWRGAWTAEDASLGWLPLFHAFGLISELLHGYRTRSRYYFGEANPRALLRLLEQAPVTMFSSVPWMLEQLLDLPGGAAALARLRWVVVGGAVLGEALGERLSSAGVRVVQQHGMTELGAVFRGSPDGGDWRDMTPVIPEAFWHLEEGTGQLIVHGDCPTLASSPGQDFPTRDTFLRAASGAYRYQTRLDDIVVHVSGEKSNALAIEQALLGRLRGRVEHVAVVGAGRLRLACVVQWRDEPTAEDRGALSDALAHVNAGLPGHSQLHEDLVLSLAPSSGARLPISPKGTVLRSRAEQELAAELEQLYGERTPAPVPPPGEPPPGGTPRSPRPTRPELRALVRAIAAEARGLEGPGGVDPSRGFAEQGFDSLMAMQLRARLQRALGVALPATLAFDHPTIDRLAEHLAADVLGLETRAAPRAARGADPGEPIAIVGAACRLPGGAEDLDAYWRLLTDGRVVATDVPADRWDSAAWYDPDPQAPGRTYVKRGGFLRDVWSFDAAFFRIAPREARTLDPQQQLLLEVGWEALEHAGEDPEALRGSATGVFVGVSAVEHAEAQDVAGDSALYLVTGNAPSVVAGRLSFFLGLHGPSLAVDTACASSLSAVHLACQSLRQGECDRALVGAVNALLSPRSFVTLSRLRALSPDGLCKPFSAAADGFGRAEGCAAVVLKRLSDAQRDGDHVLAVIRGTAMNHDGPSSGLTVPSGPAQQALLRAALTQAGLEPAAVDFVECHGTGTPLGDPIEVQALGAVYGQGRPPERPLILGGVKANLGHLEAAAGLAGLVKVVLSLQHEQLPAQPPLGALNPHIAWSELPVSVARERRAWPRGGRARVAGVSAFGLSGTNAHVILEEAPAAEPRPAAPARAAELCVLSARSPEALRAAAGRLRDHLRAHPEIGLGDLAFSLATTRGHLEHRLAVAAPSREALEAALAAAAQGETPAGDARQPARGAEPSAELAALGARYEQGHALDWERIFPARGRRVPLPSYPWQRQRWVEPRGGARRAAEDLRVDRERGPAVSSLADCYYEVAWQPQDLAELPAPPAPQPSQAAPGRWLLLADGTGVADALGAQLAVRGEACTWVVRGASYGRLSRDKLCVDPARREDFERLLAEFLEAGGGPVRGIVHLWSLDAPAPDAPEAALDAAAAQGCGLLHLIQALSRARRPGLPRVWLATRGAAPVFAASGAVGLLQAPMVGLGKVVALEHPELWGGLIDLDPAAAGGDAALLCAELRSAAGEDQVAFRGGRRCVARLERRRPPETGGVPVSPDGAYLVTGGLGGIGLRAARWLVDCGARHLVLLGRRGASERAQAALRELESAGARVEVVSADVSDAAEMARVFEGLARAATPLRGVLHAAGVGNQQAIEHLDRGALVSGLRAKLAGSWILHRLTQGMDLDFFVGFSSVASLWGGRGLAAYAAANQFLDALMHERRRLGLPGATVNWGLWEGDGLGTQEYRRHLERTGMGELRADEAFAALSGLLAAGTVQAAVVRVDPRVFRELQEARRRWPLLERMGVGAPQAVPGATASPAGATVTTASATASPAGATASPASVTAAPLDPAWRERSAGERRGALVSWLQVQAAKVLDMPASQVDPQRALNDLGMDSMTALELRDGLQRHGIGVGLQFLLDDTSIAALADVVLPQLDAAASFPSPADGATPGQGPSGARHESAAPSSTAPTTPAAPSSTAPATPAAPSSRAPAVRAIDLPAPALMRNPWVVVRRPNEQASMRLLCFPYAGGGPAVFNGWPEGLPSSVELGVVHLPGRGSRLGERPFLRMEPLVEALTPSLLPYLEGKPFVFFGHCLGALMMFEVAHRLRREHGVGPARLFVSGARAPHVYHPEQIQNDYRQYSPVPGVPGHLVPDLDLLDMLRDLGFDSSRAVYEDEEMRRLVLPAVRADFEINNTYTYAEKPPLDIPITVVGGRVDPFVNGEQILGWRAHTTGEFSATFRPGGHYFIERERPFWAEVLTRALR